MQKNVQMRFISLLISLGALALGSESAKASAVFPWLHTSVLMTFEATESYTAGYDVNMIFKNTWGIKYCFIPKVGFVEELDTGPGVNEISRTKIKGDFNSAMIMRAIDYHTFSPNASQPFDFLTAFFAFGYSEVSFKLNTRLYKADDSVLLEDNYKRRVKSPVYSSAFGLIGGERFFVIETQLLYFRGTIENGGIGQSSLKFDHFFIVFGVGVGF